MHEINFKNEFNFTVKGSLTSETVLKKCKGTKDQETEFDANFKTNTVFEDPVYLVKCQNKRRFLKKSNGIFGYTYVSIKPVKTYSCLLEESGEWASTEYIGLTCPMFEKIEENGKLGKFCLIKESIWYDKIIFEEKD